MDAMCLHVLCLSPIAPPLLSFEQIYGPFFTFFCFSFLSLSLSLSLSTSSLVSDILCWICGAHSSISIYKLPSGLSSHGFLFLGNTRNLARMPPPTSLKREFLRKWITGLQLCSSSKKEMNFVERKKAIKLSADVAMASARNAATRWSRALISKASKDDSNKGIVECILGRDLESLKGVSASMMDLHCKKNISKKILSKSRSIRRAKKSCPQKVMASYIAKRLVKKRTLVLKSLVPGGESMSEFSLIEETLDYVLSLRAQVDVMRHLANATELLNRN